MTSESHFRTYRAGPATRRMYPVWLSGGLLFGMGLLAQLFLLVEHGDGSPWMLFNLAVVASVVFGYASAKRNATVTTPDHIEIRTLFGGTEQIAWKDIEEIETKGSTKTAQAVVIHIVGRHISLPHVNSRDIASFSEEVRLLRGLWERRRGPDWAPPPGGEGASAR
ncbi:PH domain-containing protein [Streptomyces olivaceus]|uniref:PH domain-containing protein n=1 Tax=Streptomyces olivaceus TaxID=47716 RepID=UPI0009A0642B|nr:PH domain-containing protein [Streptomyces olivaceus]MBZ6203624.1 PH domain-containing protein [Streptomyces olivaceus]MBZ6294906.1 PH domain-containing protein [Streptomyces olivaceus]MBZ6308581.1 PH domain-containing protein [Streptomyces olivaceus]MBZ6322541.1 PH domain-containing protein [Streptomyces olivaceus]MBZ6329871.1 PH domain-containing protein [Streptomyces olivaceus]